MNFISKLRFFVKNTRAAMSLQAILGLAIGLTVAAAVIPTAIVNISDVTLYAGAPAAVLTLVPVLGIVAIVALLLMIIKSRR